jgi:hypothetical protein
LSETYNFLIRIAVRRRVDGTSLTSCTFIGMGIKVASVKTELFILKYHC